ncbi:anthrone oxygenase family protein [Catellatospora coxensis]|uniref:DUF1772 domain-containing protein n=1 Tax=Catellatospora coxensis TaxID=310354 RepID=A0A8J3KUM4_9ACTN|nr:anthrone oxygenase family protein [Catellatospora coxensis]GIG09372.1 hypothetical protein Cco03nite_60720 [Catellatospora coxensis]
MPQLLMLIRPTATALVGLFAGGTLFLLIAPSLSRLPATAYVPYWQALNRDYGRAMPPLLLGALALLVTASALSHRRGGLVLGLTVAATVLVTAVVVLTVTQLEPLNRLADTWTAEQPPADWADLRRRWWKLHTVRTVLALLAFAALLVASSADQGTRAPASTAGPQAAALT